MKISIITPTNVHPGLDKQWGYLLECLSSVLAQTYENWEWIILGNGKANLDDLPMDPRIRKLWCDKGRLGIGALKKEACHHATGEIIVELDHDDILIENCLEEVVKTFRDPQVDYAYSHAAEFFFDRDDQPDWAPQIYNEYWGWQYKDFWWKGRLLKEAIAFDPSPASLGLIYYAPNHVRAWRKSTYDRLGGHDEKLPVADDHDLAVRFYLHGNKMVRIPKCLYLQRMHTMNSQILMNKAIQEATRKIQNENIWSLCEKFCEINGWPKLDLGGAFYPPEGYLTVDIRPGCDFQMDLRDERWEFADNTFGLVRAFDMLEHLPNGINTMNNIHRILKPGGIVITATPSTDGRGAFADPTHCSFWNELSFKYYTDTKFCQYIWPQCRARFQTMRRLTHKPSQLSKAEDIPYVVWDGIALKPGMKTRYPGAMDWDWDRDVESLCDQ